MSDPLKLDPHHDGPMLAGITLPSNDEIRNLILSMLAKSSPMDVDIDVSHPVIR